MKQIQLNHSWLCRNIQILVIITNAGKYQLNPKKLLDYRLYKPVIIKLYQPSWNHPWQSPNATQEHHWYIQYSPCVDVLLCLGSVLTQNAPFPVKLCLQSGSFGGGIAQLRRLPAQQNTCKRKRVRKNKTKRASK